MHEAIKEALTLLPLSLDDRLKTCWFTSENFDPAGNKAKYILQLLRRSFELHINEYLANVYSQW